MCVCTNFRLAYLSTNSCATRQRRRWPVPLQRSDRCQSGSARSARRPPKDSKTKHNLKHIQESQRVAFIGRQQRQLWPLEGTGTEAAEVQRCVVNCSHLRRVMGEVNGLAPPAVVANAPIAKPSAPMANARLPAFRAVEAQRQVRNRFVRL